MHSPPERFLLLRLCWTHSPLKRFTHRGSSITYWVIYNMTFTPEKSSYRGLLTYSPSLSLSHHLTLSMPICLLSCLSPCIPVSFSFLPCDRVPVSTCVCLLAPCHMCRYSHWIKRKLANPNWGFFLFYFTVYCLSSSISFLFIEFCEFVAPDT